MIGEARIMVISRGGREAVVPVAEYRQAVAQGDVSEYLDPWLSDIEHRFEVVDLDTEAGRGLAFLDLKLPTQDGTRQAGREYLAALAQRVVVEGCGFRGGKPFGQDDWFDRELLDPMVEAGLVERRPDRLIEVQSAIRVLVAATGAMARGL